MKKLVMLIVFGLLLVLMSPTFAFAYNSSGIKIDGNFDDWDDKPFIEDPKHDINDTGLDFLNIRYIADNEYLYLCVERQSAQKNEPWHFNVVFLNGSKGDKHLVFPFGDSQPVNAPLYDITLSYDERSNSNGELVTVAIDGEDIESTYSSANNGKIIEFRIPLDKVGLNGINKEVRFMLASDADGKEGNIDWVPDGRPITVTTGSTFWELSTAILFMAVSAAAYGIYKKSHMTN